MIPNKFAYFSHGSTYRTNKEGENISDNSIAFVGDDQSIATQGKIFGVRGVYPGQEQENEDEGNTSTKIITTEPLFPLDANGKPLVGTTISVRFRYTNSYKTAGSNMCLNVNGTGAYNIYYNGSDYVSTTSANTTFCGYANREVVYTFRIDIVNNVEHPRWVFVSHGYESGNTNTIGYQLRHNSSTLPASDKFYRYRLLFTSADGKKYVPANTSSSTNATAARTVNQRPIDPFGEILYYSSTTTISAGSNPAATVLWEEYTLNLGYSFNRTGAALTMSYPAPVYIKCTPDESDGSAIIDSSTPYVQSLPSTNDGKIYIFLGIAYSATSVELMPTHPVYYHDGTGIRIWTGTALSSKQDKPIEFTSWFAENFGQFSEFPTTEETARTLTTKELAAIQDIRTNKYNWEAYGTPAIGYWEGDAIVYRWVAPFILGSERSVSCVELKRTNDSKYWIDGGFNNFVFSEDLATVATSGSYNDLSDKPNIPTSADINAAKPLVVTMTYTQNGDNVTYGANETFATMKAAYLDNREIFVVAPSASQTGDGFTMRLMSYGNDITEILTFSSTVKVFDSVVLLQATCDNFNNWGFSATQIPPVDSSITGADQTNPVQGGAIYTALENKANINDLADVATSGSYNDLLNKPEDSHQIVILVGLQETPLVFRDWDGNSLTHEQVAEIFSDPSKTVILYDDNSDVTYRYFGLFEQYYFSFIAPYNGGISYVSLEVSNPSTGIIIVREKGTVDYVPDTRKINNKRLSTNITLTASDVGALPANTHIPVDPVNADWNATSGLAEILHKPPIVQSVSINGGSAISPTNGNVDLSSIVTGIYWRQQGIPPINGIVTIPDNIVYGMLDNGLWYPGSYDTETGNWIYNEYGSSIGELGKIYVNVALDNEVETYIWTGTKFEEVISTSKYATESYVNAAINALPTPMVFQGTIGTGGTSTTVPSNPMEGDTYKIISGGQSLTFSGITGTIRIGDIVIYKNSTVGWVLIPSGDDPSGTVTSVNMTVPTGLSVSGNPITSSGTLAVSFAAGYSIPTTAKQASWDQKQNAIEIIDLT